MSRVDIEDFPHRWKFCWTALLCGKVKKYDLIFKVGGNDRKDVERETLGFEWQKPSKNESASEIVDSKKWEIRRFLLR